MTNDKKIKRGKLIVIESGTDGAGKETQTDELFTRLLLEGYKVRRISFPNYETPGGAFVQAYLNGKLGDRAGNINPNPISDGYALDRYYSYNNIDDGWGKFYEEGGIVISDRYTTSNLVHQGAKITDKKDRENYYKRILEREYKEYGLPEPDMVIFLNVSPDISKMLRESRNNKINNSDIKDIHEKDSEYLKKSYSNSLELVDRYGWINIICDNEAKDGLKQKEVINEEIYKKIKEIL